MGVSINTLASTAPEDVGVAVRNAGVAGAGGAGFPTYAKWERLDEVNALLVNHQESEPDYYKDKWIGREHASELATFVETLLDGPLDLVVVGTKQKYRGTGWLDPIVDALDADVVGPDGLPLDDDATGAVVACTDDRYEFGMESVLLRMVADVVMGNDLPMDFGWIVQNTETLHNLYRVFEDGSPVTHKFVHVDGDTPRHRFLRVPIGTPGDALLEAAGLGVEDLPDDAVLADGGPGWCFAVEEAPTDFGVRKRTNALLVLDEQTVEENTFGEERINVLDDRDWEAREHETGPTDLEPDRVRVPLISNAALTGVVQPSLPAVEPGDVVETGEMIATPASDAISNAQHASIDGEVTDVTDTHIEIRR